MNKTAVVFAYHTVGVRALSVLLAQGVDVKLVITHPDSANETIWFQSVAALANEHNIPTISPDSPHLPEVIQWIEEIKPDFIFSFYYRHMISAAILNLAQEGAYNLHGSLLPYYRGRVPVNWAVLKGETQTGATLHVMNEKPDNGAIVDQEAVPILPNDTAFDVFNKVVVAAEITLHRALPALLAGTATFTPQDLSLGGYFGGRTPDQGQIDWAQSAQSIHNLVRAVAPPYPGAFCLLGKERLNIERTLYEPTHASPIPLLYAGEDGWLYIRCLGGRLRILKATFHDQLFDALVFMNHYGHIEVPLS